MESAVSTYNSLYTQAGTFGHNILQNLKTGPSVAQAALGKLGSTAKAVAGVGDEGRYKQTFNTPLNEELKKTFASSLYSKNGSIPGTLYLSNMNVAFCSTNLVQAPNQQTWSYYKVVVPLGRISSLKPGRKTEQPKEKCIQVMTVDEHEFWFMGFADYEFMIMSKKLLNIS